MTSNVSLQHDKDEKWNIPVDVGLTGVDIETLADGLKDGVIEDAVMLADTELVGIGVGIKTLIVAVKTELLVGETVDVGVNTLVVV